MVSRRAGSSMARWVGARAVEGAEQRVVVLLADRVELVVVAPGARDGQAHERLRHHVHLVVGPLDPVLPRIDRLVAVLDEPVVGGADDRLVGAALGVEPGRRQQIPGHVLPNQLVVGHVAVERADQVVAVAPREGDVGGRLRCRAIRCSGTGPSSGAPTARRSAARRGTGRRDRHRRRATGRRRTGRPRAGVGGSPRRSNDSRRISVRRSTGGAGSSPSASSRARMNRSTAPRGHASSPTAGGSAGSTGLPRPMRAAPLVQIERLGRVRRTRRRCRVLGPRRPHLDPGNQALHRRRVQGAGRRHQHGPPLHPLHERARVRVARHHRGPAVALPRAARRGCRAAAPPKGVSSPAPWHWKHCSASSGRISVSKNSICSGLGPAGWAPARTPATRATARPRSAAQDLKLIVPRTLAPGPTSTQAAPGSPAGPSHAPPPPCAGSIVAGPGAPDGRNRGSHAAPAGRARRWRPLESGGGPSPAVSVGCPWESPVSATSSPDTRPALILNRADSRLSDTRRTLYALPRCRRAAHRPLPSLDDGHARRRAIGSPPAGQATLHAIPAAIRREWNERNGDMNVTPFHCGLSPTRANARHSSISEAASSRRSGPGDDQWDTADQSHVVGHAPVPGGRDRPDRHRSDRRARHRSQALVAALGR